MKCQLCEDQFYCEIHDADWLPHPGLVADVQTMVREAWPNLCADWEGEHCHACHRPYTDVYWLPDPAWQAITLTPSNPTAGLLCPTCALQRLAGDPRLAVTNDELAVLERLKEWGREAPDQIAGLPVSAEEGLAIEAMLEYLWGES